MDNRWLIKPKLRRHRAVRAAFGGQSPFPLGSAEHKRVRLCAASCSREFTAAHRKAHHGRFDGRHELSAVACRRCNAGGWPRNELPACGLHTRLGPGHHRRRCCPGGRSRRCGWSLHAAAEHKQHGHARADATQVPETETLAKRNSHVSLSTLRRMARNRGKRARRGADPVPFGNRGNAAHAEVLTTFRALGLRGGQFRGRIKNRSPENAGAASPTWPAERLPRARKREHRAKVACI